MRPAPAATLRLHRLDDARGQRRIQISFTDLDGKALSATIRFKFDLAVEESAQLRQDFNEYGELAARDEPGDASARDRIRELEMSLDAVGSDLFRQVFDANDDAHRIWALVLPRLGEIRVEIGEPADAESLPWELMIEPLGDRPVANRVRAFVRSHDLGTAKRRPALAVGEALRVLLVVWGSSGIAGELARMTRNVPRPFELEILRPAGDEHLSAVLAEAAREGRPYQAVHYTGHVVSQRAIGHALIEAQVPVLVLDALTDTSETVARDAATSGVPGVVILQCGWSVGSAARTTFDLYTLIVEGWSLGEAVMEARKREADRLPDETRGSARRWVSPSPLETAPVFLFDTASTAPPHVRLNVEVDAQRREALGSKMPAPPDGGLGGRDSTILALDRTFDSTSAVLLHGPAGSGKTATAAEFGRWYQQTGGLGHADEGIVMFTSFDQGTATLTMLLDEVGMTFTQVLEASDISWYMLQDGQRQTVALQILEQIPTLWILDGVEVVASHDEQRELTFFLDQLRSTMAKTLITSREESVWLRHRAVSVALPPLTSSEGLKLVRSLVERRLPARFTDIATWRSLLDYTGGNPVVITVLVSTLLRDGTIGRADIEGLVRELGMGEPDLAGGSPASLLAVSLRHVVRDMLEKAFTDHERSQLAVLHLFRESVNPDALRLMGDVGGVSELRDLDGPRATALLDRVAKMGLLEVRDDAWYAIQPAFESYFDQLFAETYCKADDVRADAARQAYVEAIGTLARQWYRAYEVGAQEAFVTLSMGEANLLHARHLAQELGDLPQAIACMQSLWVLYEQTGRTTEWARLVEEMTPALVNDATGGPRPSLEDEWTLLSYYRVRLARTRGRWEEAEELQRRIVEAERGRAVEPSPERRLALAGAVAGLGHLLREQEKAECVELYKEASDLLASIGARREQAVVAFNLATAYARIPAARSLADAELWFERSLEFLPEEDRLGRGRAISELGRLALERFTEASASGDPEVNRHLEDARHNYTTAKELVPSGASTDLAVINSQLGNVLSFLGSSDEAIYHYIDAIREYDAVGNRYAASRVRVNVATALGRIGRFDEASAFAGEALRDLEAYGDRATGDIEEARRLVELLGPGVAGPGRAAAEAGGAGEAGAQEGASTT